MLPDLTLCGFRQVARYHSARDAQYISQSYIFTACIACLVVGFLFKWSRRYKVWGVIGVVLHMVGAVLMIRFRGLDNPTSELVLSQVIGGVGGGLTTLAAQLGVQSVVSHQGGPTFCRCVLIESYKLTGRTWQTSA